MDRLSGWNSQSSASGAKLCMMLELGTLRKVDQKYGAGNMVLEKHGEVQPGRSSEK